MASFFKKPTVTNCTVEGSTANDIALPSDATDTISSIRFSKASDHLAVASWDGKARVYDVAKTGTAQGVAMITAEGPVFSCDWSKDGTVIAAAGADKKVHVLQAASGQTIAFAAHDAPIRDVRFVDVPSAATPIIASGSWDKTVKYWDIRQTASPVSTIQCSERVYSMDSAGPVLIIATADLKHHIVNLHADPTKIVRSDTTKLQHQTRCVALSPDAKYWATGSIEGRCSVTTVDPKAADVDNFTWKCHRGEQDAKKVTKVWALNGLAYHPIKPTCLATAGSDGTFNFWDVKARSRLKTFPNVGGALTACAFNRTGLLFAYAVGYDWSMGYQHNTPQYPNKLMLHPVRESDINKQRK